MKFKKQLIRGILKTRLNRFLADIELGNRHRVMAHCPNSGSLLTCNQPGRPVMLSEASNPHRRTRYTWEMIRIGRSWVGINTLLANKLVVEAIKSGRIPELNEYPSLRTEVKYGENSRIDILLEDHGKLCYVEVKNVTLKDKGIARFPDAVTERGTRHLRELRNMVRLGHRAVMFYVVQRKDCNSFQPAENIDPVYAKTLVESHESGVEVLVYQAKVSPEEIVITTPLPYEV